MVTIQRGWHLKNVYRRLPSKAVLAFSLVFLAQGRLASPARADNSEGAAESDNLADSCQTLSAGEIEFGPAHQYVLLARCHREKPNLKALERLRTLAAELAKKGYTKVSLSFSPKETEGHTAKLPLSLAHEDEVWLRKGDHQITLSSPNYETDAFAIKIDSPIAIVIPFRLRAVRRSDTHIELGEGNEEDLGTVERQADPRDKKFKNLLKEKYRRAPDPVPIPKGERNEQRRGSPLVLPGALLSVAALGAALVLQDRDESEWALVSSGVALLAGGTSVWLYVRSDRARPGADRIPENDALIFGVTGSF